MTRKAPVLIRMMLLATIAFSATTSWGVASSRGPGRPSDPERKSPGSRTRVNAAVTSDRTAESTIDINGGFETGDFTGWQFPGPIADVAIVSNNPPPACFAPDMPSEGTHMACLSTEDFFGGIANGDVRSDLTSDPIALPFRPAKISVSFTVDFQTQEDLPSVVFNDAFQARLVTHGGTFVMLQIDTFGRTTPGGGLHVEDFTDFSDSPPGCALTEGKNTGHDTGRLRVSWTKNVDALLRRAIGLGPVYIEFSISDQGGPDRTSIACVDEVNLKVSRP